eukprot:COSAG02_NODE_47634_length_340_cov_0.427386_1_plen_40_part_00
MAITVDVLSVLWLQPYVLHMSWWWAVRVILSPAQETHDG